MVQFLDVNQVRNNFNKYASNYSHNALLQKIVAKSTVDLAVSNIRNSKQLLDLGSGTGFIAKNIKNNFLNKKIYQLDFSYNMLKESFVDKDIFNINSDIEYLPFKNNSFDLVISSLTLQWLNDLNKSIDNIRNLLNNNGFLIFSIVGDGSLGELKISCSKLKINLSINNFITKEELNDIIFNKFSSHDIISSKLEFTYENVYELLRSIKSIGASYSNRCNNNFITRDDFNKINTFYLKNFNLNSKIVASWNIFYAICKV